MVNGFHKLLAVGLSSLLSVSKFSAHNILRCFSCQEMISVQKRPFNFLFIGSSSFILKKPLASGAFFSPEAVIYIFSKRCVEKRWKTQTKSQMCFHLKGS